MLERRVVRKCCKDVLKRRVVRMCWKEVLPRSVGKTCCKEVLKGSTETTACKEVLKRRVVKMCWNTCCKDMLTRRVVKKCFKEMLKDVLYKKVVSKCWNTCCKNVVKKSCAKILCKDATTMICIRVRGFVRFTLTLVCQHCLQDFGKIKCYVVDHKRSKEDENHTVSTSFGHSNKGTCRLQNMSFGFIHVHANLIWLLHFLWIATCDC